MSRTLIGGTLGIDKPHPLVVVVFFFLLLTYLFEPSPRSERQEICGSYAHAILFPQKVLSPFTLRRILMELHNFTKFGIRKWSMVVIF